MKQKLKSLILLTFCSGIFLGMSLTCSVIAFEQPEYAIISIFSISWMCFSLIAVRKIKKKIETELGDKK